MAERRRSPRAQKTRDTMNHVFVDFENVPTVDLGLISDKTTEITLLIGEKQRRLELGLVRQIHQYAAKVILVEVGASGRNALDLVLAWHLGKTAERCPKDAFFVVSKDKDFDPLLTHLRTAGFSIERVDAFALLPFLSPRPVPKKSVLPRRPTVAAAPAVPRPASMPEPLASAFPENDRLSKIIDRFQRKTKARPVRRKTLLSHLNGFYQNQLSEPELEAIVATLQRRGIIEINARGAVTYPESR